MLVSPLGTRDLQWQLAHVVSTQRCQLQQRVIFPRFPISAQAWLSGYHALWQIPSNQVLRTGSSAARSPRSSNHKSLAIVSIAVFTCASLCMQLMKNRKRAARSSTAG